MNNVVTSAIDSHVTEDNPGQNFADRAKLKLDGSAGGDTANAYIHFTRPFPLGATVISATLRVYLADSWPSTYTLTAKRITQTWAEDRINWTNRPNVTATNSDDATVTAGDTGDEVEFDVSLMMGQVSNGADWFGFRIEIDTGSDKNIYASDNPTAAYRPVLEVEWSEGPHPPSNLAPSAGRAISVSKPILNWKFVDNLGETEQSSSQVQISTSTDFTSPEYDSGKVANTESQWDLSATAYAGLAADDVRYWRVKVWDGTDIASEYSDIESFTRKTKGTLTITNPAASPNDYVEETTPPLTWTFTGRTQERAEVALYKQKQNLTWERIYFWPDETVGTSVTVPKNLLKSNKLYKVRVRVWDTLDRQGINGDPRYVQATREFTYNRSGTPTSPSSLTAVADGDSPKVTLTWVRATQPDFFSLRIDGEEVEDEIDPVETFVSGTTYSMDWWTAAPTHEAEYEIEAVVLDSGKLKHSDANPTDEAVTNAYGIWLVDNDDGTNVFIAGQENADFSIGETASTFQPLGNRRPVRITETIRGYEGTISGILLDHAARDTILDLKGRLVGLRLILSDMNIPVRLEEVSVAPLPNPGTNEFSVSVTFFQTADFPMEVAGD